MCSSYMNNKSYEENLQALEIRMANSSYMFILTKWHKNIQKLRIVYNTSLLGGFPAKISQGKC